MYSICSKEMCTGCALCVNICPVKCINMVEDKEGFLYPRIDVERCINCNLCREKCPGLNLDLNKNKIFKEPEIYSSWSKDKNIRKESSSGGLFSEMASKILEEEGVIYGAVYDEDLNVYHERISEKNYLSKLRGSKYVQSNLNNTFIKVKEDLSKGKKVLYSGTPCQIEALNIFLLNEDTKNLLTIDLLCHGVPSPKLFKKYINFLEKKNKKKIVNFSFRDKRKRCGISTRIAYFEDGSSKILKGIEDSYIEGFAKSLSLRTCCYGCKYSSLERKGDITLGDFWGIEKLENINYDIKDGVSLMMINSLKGNEILEKLNKNIFLDRREVDEMKEKRTGISKISEKPKYRDKIYIKFNFEYIAKNYFMDKGLKRLIKQFIPREVIYFLNKALKRI